MNRVLFILLLVFSATTTYAQLQFGLKTGLHFNNVDLVVDIAGEPAEYATNLT